jgi:hypothetical protein
LLAYKQVFHFKGQPPFEGKSFAFMLMLRNLSTMVGLESIIAELLSLAVSHGG